MRSVAMSFDIGPPRLWSAALRRGKFLSIISNWLIRALMGLVGACLFFGALPVARGAWEAQKADSILTDLRLGHPLDLAEVREGIAHLDRAIAIDPDAGRYFDRSELLGGAGLTYSLKVADSERADWQRRGRADLEKALPESPARGLEWLRLAALDQVIDGPSRDVLPPLFLSMEYAPLIPQGWPSRLRIILDNWPYFSDAQKDQVTAYMRLTWRAAEDKRFFVQAIYAPADELIIRFFLRDEPGAQEEFTRLIMHEMKH